MNRFEIVGRLNWLNIKYFDSGACRTKILLAKQKPQSKNNQGNSKVYETFPIFLFNTSIDNVAERIAEECKQGDYLHIVGTMTRNKPSENKPEETQLIGWDYKKVIWSDDKKKYVYEDNEDEIVGYGKINR